ncbi:serine--tRNA ligase, mitochondrial isoform X2 [Nilaparvata lugens]|uniref:serine--tRNA ligase, mitochondrial isoform X2 n=1 Tax=Nilaparvata lugens TaxID=108931 RepID=UPI00193CA68B|nr:serine--tRNA ligase, mitochondrial isoform X2 [Nilaparvata lugens]
MCILCQIQKVYSLDSQVYGPDLCLSGTSEMALAGFLMKKRLSPADLPLRLAAVSRCYRAETSRSSNERGIFRVHQFTKVEMFGVTEADGSDELLEEFRAIQEETFGELGLHFQVLDMPPCELGAQAYRKYDVEAWMPGRALYGEVSSCSSCTDYQSRRLDIRIKNSDRFAHTVNGTALAVPRTILSLVENFQNKDATVEIPLALQPFMVNSKLITRNTTFPKIAPHRSKA